MKLPVRVSTSLLIVLAPLALAQAQAPVPTVGTANMAVAISQARQKNAALMKQFTWNERVELLKADKMLDLRIDLVTYGPTGQLQRNVISDQHSPPPRGFFRKRIADSEKKDLEEYLKGLRSLLDQYTLPTAGAILNFLTTAQTTGPGPNGLLTTAGSSVVQPDDSLTILTDPATRQTRNVSVNTSYQGNPVVLNATFRTLPSGLTYMNYATVEVPAKQIELLVQNFDYVQN